MLVFQGKLGKKNCMYYHVCYISSCSSELASGIVSTGLQCGTGRCPTDDLQLDTPVRITIEHSDTVKVVHYVLCCWCCY